MRPLIEDFPSQFKGKPKIEALCACFDRQFAEIEQCFQQLLFLLDIAVRKFKFKWIHEIVRDRRTKRSMVEENDAAKQKM